MRCSNYVALEQYGKKGKTRRVVSRPEWTVREGDNRTLLPDPCYPKATQIWNQCPGFVSCKIKAVDEPDWGDHYAKLDVQFHCSYCGEHKFTAVGMPSANDFEAWVNDLMSSVYEMKFEDEITARNGFQDVENALGGKLLAEGVLEPYYAAKKKVWDAALKWGKKSVSD